MLKLAILSEFNPKINNGLQKNIEFQNFYAEFGTYNPYVEILDKRLRTDGVFVAPTEYRVRTDWGICTPK